MTPGLTPVTALTAWQSAPLAAVYLASLGTESSERVRGCAPSAHDRGSG